MLSRFPWEHMVDQKTNSANDDTNRILVAITYPMYQTHAGA